MTAVVGLVLGGVAAVVLALVIALGGYGHGKPATAPRATASHAAPDLSAELPVEYLPDTGDQNTAPAK